jgi:glycosyltransferase involved in cell wall biosynthesis
MITVIIASYRYGHLAAHCIESILSQTKKPEKVLFVDDGVGDCEHLSKIYSNIEYVFRKNNLGIVDNFQDMLMRSKTEYTIFLGADNWIRSDTVESFESVVQRHACDVIIYDIMVTGELKNEISNAYPHQVTTRFGDVYWARKNSHHGSMMYRTKLGQEVGYKKRDSQSKNSDEDWYLWEQMLNRGATVSYVPEALLYYRRHKENFNFVKNKITK